MKHFLKVELFFIFVVIFTACSPKIVPVHNDTTVVYRDTTIFRTDTVEVPLPVERVVEVVPEMDTLILRTSLAESKTWLDTTRRMLRGEIRNTKTSVQAEINVPENFHSRDSVATVEIPVTVEVEKKVYPRWLIIISILGAVCITAEIMRIFIH